MVYITFISHKTTNDNENQIASGWNDVPLSELGLQQARETRQYFADRKFDHVFCSDQQRSYNTGLLVFQDHLQPITMDWRLRECNYGDMNGCPKKQMEEMRLECVNGAYPNGESYSDCLRRMTDFLNELKTRYDDCSVAIIGHRATQYGLECVCAGKSLTEVIIAPWSWQQEWYYELESIHNDKVE